MRKVGNEKNADEHPFIHSPISMREWMLSILYAYKKGFYTVLVTLFGVGHSAGLKLIGHTHTNRWAVQNLLRARHKVETPHSTPHITGKYKTSVIVYTVYYD